ncbi:MAG: calcium-binding protein [Hyphomicrobiaceae bacterium]
MATIATKPIGVTGTLGLGSQLPLPRIVLTEQADTYNYFGGSTAQEIYALGGNDIFTIGNGDIAYAGEGDDTIAVFGNATVNGGNGSDTFAANILDHNELIPNRGWTYVDLAAGKATINVDYAGTVVNMSQTLVSIENAFGTAGSDYLLGDAGANILWGERGDDYIDGRAGNDTLYGGVGYDKLIGGSGADLLDGGENLDTASYITSTSGLTLDLARPSQSTGDAAGDTFVSIEYFEMSQFNDTFVGGAAGDTVYGRDGVDRLIGNGGGDILYGDGGNDVLYGGDGNDILHGGEGIDYLYGDAGADSLFGGGGTDYFMFRAKGWGQDGIGDFQDGIDKIDLRSLAGQGVHSLADLTITQNVYGGNYPQTTVAIGEDKIYLNNIWSSQVTASDFIFA